MPGVFHSDVLQVTERFTRVDRDQLNYEAIIEDSKVLTAPWKVSATLMFREGTRLREYACMENTLDIQGYQEFLEKPGYSRVKQKRRERAVPECATVPSGHVRRYLFRGFDERRFPSAGSGASLPMAIRTAAVPN